MMVVSPESTTVFQGAAVPSADIGGDLLNYFVPII